MEDHISPWTTNAIYNQPIFQNEHLLRPVLDTYAYADACELLRYLSSRIYTEEYQIDSDVRAVAA